MGAKTKDYDFAGWVTKNDVKCSDGRTIRHNAFAHMDGKRVSLVYNHNHEDIDNVLGYVDLENRDEGVYGYAKCANTDMGNTAKELVHSGSLVSFSIFANNLSEQNGDVMHGDIKEVSLVLAGANKEALIDEFFEHGVDGETGMFFYNAEGDCEFTEDFLSHSDDEDEKDEEKDESKETESEDKQDDKAEDKEDDSEEGKEEEEIKHSEDLNKEESEGGQTLAEAYEEMPEKYKKVCAALVGMATSSDDSDDEVEHSDEGGEIMKQNMFEVDEKKQENVLEHSDVEAIFDSAKTGGSLKKAFTDYCLAHSIDTTGMNLLPSNATANQNYGVRDLDMLFPDYKAESAIPEFIKRDTTWVDVVMAGVKKVPFKRIKSMYANITEDEARAKGYTKGDEKDSEVFELLGRTTDPQTIYKFQTLDRDDILDIEEFDVVVWIKKEMQIMLDEEKARAILIGDGRTSNNKYKIKEDHVRSIVNDVPLYNIKVNVTVATNADEDVKYKEFIKATLRARKQYKGSGNPTLFTTEDVLTECLLLEDKMGHPLYNDINALATKLRVARIVTVEVMEGKQVDSKDLLGVIVNLNDYTVGGDTNREKGMFDDFDIKFNEYQYLIETRMSGALTRPFSAMTILLNEVEEQQEQAQG